MCTLAVVKLRETDKKKLEKLTSAVSRMKGKANTSEVLGLSLSFVEKNLDEFLAMTISDLSDEPALNIIRHAAKGQKSDATKVKEYLYS